MRTHTWPLSEKDRVEVFQAELITFDLFNTIAYRPGSARAQFSVYGCLGSFLRQALEMFWRVLQKIGVVKDFKLNSLFLVFRSKIFKEFEYDLKQLHGRRQIIELIQDLAISEKRILLLSNSYYSESQIRKICEKLNIPSSIPLIVSSEFGVIKSQGLLQSAIDYIPEKHWHFGDDVKEDRGVSRSDFVLINPVWSQSPLLQSIFALKIFNKKDSLAIRRAALKIALEEENLYQDFFWFGVLFSGPASVHIAQQVNTIAKKTPGDIFFLSRDGYLPYRYLERENGKSVFYIPYSRAISASAEDLQYLFEWICSTSSSSKKLFFDLGWRGKSASKIVQMFGDKGILILGGRWPWYRLKHENYSIFWKDHQILKALEYRRFPELYELAMSAPHNSVSKLPDELHSWSLNLVGDEDRQLIANGAIAFQEQWRNEGNVLIDSKVAFSLFRFVIRKPLLSIVKMLEDTKHDFGNQMIPLVSHENQPVIFWIRGSLSRQKIMGVPMLMRLKWVTQEISRRSPLPFREWSR